MRILLATDGTQHSEKAVNMATNFVFPEGSEIKIISIVDMALPLTVDIYTGFVPTTLEIEQIAKENAAKVLSETKILLTEKLPNVKITTDVLLGSPESRIVEAAEEMKSDVIIVGSHGYNRWERLLLGSVSDSVVHHAPCSVLVVRH
jgi:nucleotide-binding universal stress UspA family protein